MRPSISIWGFVRPLVRRSVRPSVKHSLNSPKFNNSPISTERKWIKVFNDVHVHPINRQNNHHDNHNYHNDHSKTMKKRRRIFDRQNLFTLVIAVDSKEALCPHFNRNAFHTSLHCRFFWNGLVGMYQTLGDTLVASSLESLGVWEINTDHDASWWKRQRF